MEEKLEELVDLHGINAVINTLVVICANKSKGSVEFDTFNKWKRLAHKLDDINDA